MLTSRADAQNVPADQVAQAIDDLSQATLAKIDSEIEINARAFADAKNIQSSLVWGDWFRPILDIAYGVYEAVTIIPNKNPNSVRTWLKTSIQAADAGKKGFSIFGSFDRLRQDGATLALAIDGPAAYNSSVSAMLDRADATSFFFNYALYKNSAQNDLYGTFWQANPLRVSHKSTAFDRSGGDVFNSILEARSYVASQFATLSAQMRQTQLPPAQISSLVSFIQARRQDVLQSRVGPRNVSYQACRAERARP